MKKQTETMERAFEKLLSKYKKAWEQRDPDLALELFTPDAEDPFDPRPFRGHQEIRHYWAQVPKFQKNITFSYGPVFRLEDSRVWGVEWRAQYTKVETGERIRLRGVLFCELYVQRIKRFWEFWHLKGGEPSFRADGPVLGRGTRMKRRRVGYRKKLARNLQVSVTKMLHM